MKTACNSAYIQTKTLNFTFTWQDVILHFYFRSNFLEIAMPKDEYKCTSQLFFANNFGLNINSQQISIRPNNLHTLNFYCY